MQAFSMKFFLLFLVFPALEFLEMNCACSEQFRFVIVALKIWTAFPMLQILSAEIWSSATHKLTLFGTKEIHPSLQGHKDKPKAFWAAAAISPKNSGTENGRKCDSEKQMQEFSMKFLHFLPFPVLEFLEMNCAGSERFRFVIVALKTWTEFPMFQILSTYVRLITKFQMLIQSRS